MVAAIKPSPAGERDRFKAAGEPGYYSITQAAARLGVSRVSVWRWIRAGYMPVVRLGHRTTRIKREDVERALIQTRPGRTRSSPIPRRGAAAGAEDETASHADWRGMGGDEHFVQFYEADAFLLDAVAGYLGEALRAGDAAIAVATPAHRAGLAERLRADGLDLTPAQSSGRYVSLDAAETLSLIMVDGRPDPERFARVGGRIISRASEGTRHVRVFGEMVALLAEDGDFSGAIRMEELWNELQETHAFSLFCGYPLDCLGGVALAERLHEVCAAHQRVIPAESYTTLPNLDERLRTVAALQQKARSLEAEIAERKGAEERLQRALESERAAREEAEAALRLRDEFLSIAAHELKTPLTGVLGHAQLVVRMFEREGQPEQKRVVQSLQAIRGQADKLARLVRQLLDISRLEEGKLMLERQPADLGALAEEVVAGVTAWNAEHPITLDAVSSPVIRADPLRLEQVLTNLLDNAIKYSPKDGSIEVALSEPRDGWVEISVRDHGPGIPPEKREQIFERFYQAHGDGHLRGLGLGLFISRQIVELHGGEIRAEFPADGGTRFVVRLPIESPEPYHPG